MAARPERVAALPSFETLHSALVEGGVEALLTTCESRVATARAPVWELVAAAVRLGAPALAADPGQLAGQLVGRLRARATADPAVAALVAEVGAWQGAAWLRPATASLAPPGGPLVRVLSRGGTAPTAVALTPDGGRVVAGCDDGTLQLWDVDDYGPPVVLEGHDGLVKSIAVAPDGIWAVSGGADGTLRLWDLERARAIGVLEGHDDWVRAVTLTPDGRRAVSGGDDNTVRVWDLHNRLPVAVLEGHEDWVRSVAVSHDGRVAVSGADDGTLRTWDLDRLEPISTAQGAWIGVWCQVAVTAGGTVVSSTDNGVQVRDLGGLHQLGDDHQVGKVVALATGAAGRLVVCGLEDGSLHAWDPAGAPAGAPIGRLGNAVRSMALSGDDRLAAVSAVDGTLTLWDLTAGAGDPVRHPEPVKAVAVSHDGRVAVSGCGGDLLKVWEAGLPAPRTTFDGYEARALRMGADGRRVLVSADSVTVLDVERGTVVSQLEHDFTLWPPAALAASRGLVGLSAATDGTVTVWDADRLEQLGTLAGHGHRVTALAVAPGGRLAACATNDGLVRLWDIRTTTVVASFTTDVRATVLAVADTGPFAVVAGDASGAVHLLELVSPG